VVVVAQSDLSQVTLAGVADPGDPEADEELAAVSGQSAGGRRPGRGREDWFRVFALVVVAIFLVRSTNLLAPWFFVLTPDEPNPEAHRWFYTVAVTGDLFLLVSFAVLMNRLRRPPLAATAALWLLLTVTMIVPFEPRFLIPLIFIAPAYLLYPYWEDLGGSRAWWTAAHTWLVVFAVVVGAGLLATSVVAMRKQILNDGPVADAHLWNDYAMHSALIAVVAVLAAGTAAGARLLRGWLGLVAIYLGAVATFALPDATGSWGVAGGVTAMVVGAVFLVSTWWDRRRQRRRAEEEQAEHATLPVRRDDPTGTTATAALPEQRQRAGESEDDREVLDSTTAGPPAD
jgi:hypothetical protein